MNWLDTLNLIFSPETLPALIGLCTLFVTFTVIFIAFLISKNYVDHVNEIKAFNIQMNEIKIRMDANGGLARSNQIRHALSLHTITLMLAIQESQKYVEQHEKEMVARGDKRGLEVAREESELLGMRMKKRQAELRYLSHVDGLKENIIRQLTYLEPDLHTVRFFEILEESCLDSEEERILQSARAIIEHEAAAV